jgi:hypothetical protein
MRQASIGFQDKGTNYRGQLALFDSIGEIATYAEQSEQFASGSKKVGSRWTGFESLEDAIERARSGDLSRVAKSDEYLSKLETLIGFETRKFRTIDDVAGGVPNVPAMLAGHPMAMRRRARVASEQAPLTVVIDTTSSASVPADKLTERGAALLAFIRVVSAVRPVTLWMACGLGATPTVASILAYQIDTAPIDLARSAHVACSTAWTRSALYASCSNLYGALIGGWPFGDVGAWRRNAAMLLKQALGVDEVMFLPPVFGDELEVTKPDQWLKEMVAKYGRAAE